MRGGYAVVDVETTGIHPGSHHRVIEVAVVRLDPGGNTVDEWVTLINPRRDLGSQQIHGISAAEIRRAPAFEEIAGDLARLLTGHVLVAHNLSFDLRFLVSEFVRAGVDAPVAHESGLCTMHLAAQVLPGTGRTLTACCRAAGVALENAHSALYDARAAAGLLRRYLDIVGEPVPWAGVLSEARSRPWPTLPTGIADPVTRDHAYQQRKHFLARLVDSLPSVPDDPHADDYLAVLDAALIDRHLSESEQDELVAVAQDLNLTVEQVMRLHEGYLLEIAKAAWHDGVVTEDERGDLHLTARLLGLAPAVVDGALASAQETIRADGNGARGRAADGLGRFALTPGDRVLFTGQMQLGRDEWRERARAAGLSVNGANVTRRTGLVVAADPDSQSGKARKAREYGVPIITEPAFAALLDELVSGGRDVQVGSDLA